RLAAGHAKNAGLLLFQPGWRLPLRRDCGVVNGMWGLNIAYSLSTLYYQTVSFSDHPRYSLVCILAVVLFNVVLFGLLRRARSRVDVSLLATRKTPASCCSSPAGDCH
ncbi:hypothetical protein, partial [Salmonella enterica]|uniref:hypothetical protein n=1 Tax=Salmonella enterica TaxID=28901 RepID=UPI00313689BB